MVYSSLDDVSESISREVTKKQGSNTKQPLSIGFMDVSQMSGLTASVYMSAAFGLLFTAMYWFYNVLVKRSEEE
jgi:hypothetical protein